MYIKEARQSCELLDAIASCDEERGIITISELRTAIYSNSTLLSVNFSHRVVLRNDEFHEKDRWMP